jgi:RNA polymerase sigma-70 factor (ECF subfamily)
MVLAPRCHIPAGYLVHTREGPDDEECDVRSDELGGPGDSEVRIETVWLEHRAFAVDLAFRMLGNISDAEDMVQEAFTRLFRADLDEIDDVRGWLVVVVSRLCLDTLRSARSRRERRSGRGGEVAEDAAVDPFGDPADRVTLDDSVRMALLVVLERLSPPERAVFVLHDVFGFPFETVASIVGRTPAACRKLASRARNRVATETGPDRFAVDPAAHLQISERFIAACAGGDLETLTRLLDANVGGEVDLAPGVVLRPVLVGPARVAQNLLRFFGGATGTTLVSQPINGRPGVLAFRDGELYALVALEDRAGLIVDIHAIRDPAKLALVSGQMGPRR